MLDILRRLVQAVTDAATLDEALTIIVTRIKGTMQTGVCSVYLLDESTDRWLLMATDGLNPSSVRVASLAKTEGLVGTVGSRGELVNLDDAPNHPAFRFLRETGEEIFQSFLGVPIVHQREILGVLVVQQTTQRKFSDDEEALLVTVAAQISALIAHAKVSGRLQLSHTDGEKPFDVHFQGVAGVSGVTTGTAFVRQPPAILRRVKDAKTDDPKRELEDFQSALSEVKAELRQISDTLSEHLERKETALFDTYLRMLEDHTLSGEVCQRIRSGETAPTALKYVVLDLVARFNAMDDAYLRERATDLLDLGRRILAKLLREQSESFEYPDDLILVAEDVTPVMLGEVATRSLRAIVSVKGSANSHVAILARSLGIPAVMGAVDLPLGEISGAHLIVDGWRGEVIVEPSEHVLSEYQRAIQDAAILEMDLEQVEPGTAVTSDGQHVYLMLNAGPFGELSKRERSWIDGVGLYRTEFIFLSRSRFPTEDEQEGEYRAELQSYSPMPVVMRTLDIGGDKSLPYFSIDEENPFLGWRGIRVTLDHPEIFLTQIRAMLKADSGLGNLRILLPMITTLEELRASKILIQRVVLELASEGYEVLAPQVGVMIEVPSAVYIAPELAKEADFLSVGSNDLTQYLLAVDRTNSRVADMFDGFHPAILRALEITSKAGTNAKIPVALCGEMAGDPLAAVLLVGLGFKELSMSSAALAQVKRALGAFSSKECQSLAQQALAMESGVEVLHIVGQAFIDKDLNLLVPPNLRESI
ncbi:MAG: phosphoenolpyruvate--protein phosphotransferase [Litorivicinaceae bacterium]|nr:phosphoenolpyruvate--protein phosphotransferase [Gammaproteobacteria bacterium]RPG21095.1 MAG: phosphoenolpyruvate-protein phosphotransferase PtsP [Oceanospirillales bacterium TMED33]RZO77154.1 MAG: phosphoenolpyruvate--protein phosphotransferase [Litorivicinaceae bacterium]CAI8352329.1 MAG: Phosphoenolpyruvate-dependent phosphotransferase system [Gammaproteobacteria bacterium]